MIEEIAKEKITSINRDIFNNDVPFNAKLLSDATFSEAVEKEIDIFETEEEEATYLKGYRLGLVVAYIYAVRLARL